jgi:hypothetical protein
MTNGFRASRYPPRSGRGIYVTSDLEIARNWARVERCAPVVIRCRIRSGLRVLWRELNPSPKTLDYLKREFGKEILDPARFYQSIPRNKQLTRKELVHLASHFRSLGWWPTNKSLALLRGHLTRHGFDAFADATEEDWVFPHEMVVFNPAFVEPIEVYKVERYRLWGSPLTAEALSKLAREEDD